MIGEQYSCHLIVRSMKYRMSLIIMPLQRTLRVCSCNHVTTTALAYLTQICGSLVLLLSTLSLHSAIVKPLCASGESVRHFHESCLRVAE
jgi:hypothetical protein